MVAPYGENEGQLGGVMAEITRETMREDIERMYQSSFLRRWWGIIGRMLARLAGQKGEAPMWVSAAIVLLLIQVVTTITAFVIKDWSATSVSFIYSYPMLFYIWFCIIVLHVQVERFIGYIKDDFVNALDLSASQKTMKAWLNNTGRHSTQVFAILFFVVWMTVVTIYVLYSQRNQPAGPSVYLFTVLVFVSIASHLYWVLNISITFAFWIPKIKFNLFPDDPSQTPVMLTMHQVSSSLLLMVALLLALNIIIIIPLNLYSRIYLIAILSVFWLPLLLYFFLSEAAFSRLVVNARIQRLATIQQQIMEIENKQDMSQKETAEAVKRLLDLHDRVKATPVSMINLGSITNLLGSLALPLLAVLINLFDIWQKIFGSSQP